jgi:hypothetical protein
MSWRNTAYESRHNTTKYTLKRKLTQIKQAGSWQHMESAAVYPNVPTVFRGIFGDFSVISKFLFIYSMISRGTPEDVRKPGWELLL